ncbi:MAG: ytrB 1 [Verrucomicrobiales bacterium]|nr:ytrB 1 [Verrucomicrobiales bacterium]
MQGNAIEIKNLSRTFSSKKALDNLSLSIPKGVVFGLVGPNGAGKTTLIKHILGLCRAQSGSVSVFGMDPVKDPVGVLSRTGYVSENRDLPGWMTVKQFIHYKKAFYPQWDDALAASLKTKFELPDANIIGTLSQGQLARLSLVVALAFRPDLLLLDEPSSGLDPIVRRDILEAIILTVVEEGRTVVFSSHLLDEVERVSNGLAMMAHGKIVAQGEIDSIKNKYSAMSIRFGKEFLIGPILGGKRPINGSGREWCFLATDGDQIFHSEMRRSGGEILQSEPATLEQIFVAECHGI